MIESSNDKKINFGHWVDDALCGPWQLMQLSGFWQSPSWEGCAQFMQLLLELQYKAICPNLWQLKQLINGGL